MEKGAPPLPFFMPAFFGRWLWAAQCLAAQWKSAIFLIAPSSNGSACPATATGRVNENTVPCGSLASCVTVPANGDATLGVDVKPGADFDSSVAQNTPNGTFLDGFVRFTSRTDSQPDLTVPYLGFYGNWGKPAIFDQLNSDGWEIGRAHV